MSSWVRSPDTAFCFSNAGIWTFQYASADARSGKIRVVVGLLLVHLCHEVGGCIV